MFSAGQLEASGGKLEVKTEDEGIDLGGDAAAIIGVILALAAGVIAAPALVDADENANLDGLPDVVNDLIAQDKLPVEQLKEMGNGHYTLGDLVLLLDNAQHVAEEDGVAPARAAGSAGAEAAVAPHTAIAHQLVRQ